MFLIGIFIHLTFLFSIFDIYFKSPIVKNVVPYKPQHAAVADRLVLFVVDGLRAESFVNYTTMKYLRSVANNHGRWGISNTQVPTESRPGHVAIIAGFYEDPSAVAKGWKANPVDFDSVFNQTFHTWCWGTYDIVNIFTKGLTDNHITVNDFDPYDQSFSTNLDTTDLDAWVFEKVKYFFESAKDDNELRDKLQEKKIVFFLHLLGTDTSGHTHKPKTLGFLNTLTHVDEGIRRIESVFRDFYNDDGKTTFLMTSDHGMTDWGSHGAGDHHETETPYVIWGAGVQQAKQSQVDSQTLDLSLDHRLDINQVDLSPLMSTILSIPVPVNSIGKPIDGLLDLSLSNKAKSIYSVSRQLASQYDKKRQDVEKNAIKILYQPYDPLTKRKLEEIITFTEKLLEDEEFEELILFSYEIIELSLSGLRYYHNYYQKPLLILVTLSFLGWIVCLLKILFKQKVNTQTEHSSVYKYSFAPSKRIVDNCMKTVFLILCAIACYLVHEQNLPIQYYVYCLMPIFLWYYALSPVDMWINAFKQVKRSRQFSILWIEVICYVLASFVMALSFTYRWMLSIPLLGMGLWPFFSSSRNHLSIPILASWSIGCLLLSVFSFMPVVGKDVFIELVLLAGLLWLFILVFYISKVLLPLYYNREENQREVFLACIQILLLVISLHNIYVQSKRYREGTPVSYFYQAMAWIIAVLSPLVPLAFSKRMLCRLVAIHTAILNFYLLLSVSHEGLFFVTLISTLMCWVFIEFRLLHLDKVQIYGIKSLYCWLVSAPTNSIVPFCSAFIRMSSNIIGCSFENDIDKNSSLITVERSINHQDFRRALFFVLFIVLAFFGTGNIASMNSFEIRWVTCFITSFKPFVITILILLKTLAPFLSVACSFRAVQKITKAPVGYLNIIVLIYSNLMGIQLLFYVKNTGSWLEIGTSISQFVIVQVITLFIVLINQIAKCLTDISILNVAGKVFKSRKKYV